MRSEDMVPDGVDAAYIDTLVESTGFRHILLTRPMTLADAESSRRKSSRKGIRSMRILGLGESPCLAVHLGSNDGTHYEPLRQFNPHVASLLLSPPRLFHRLLLLSDTPLSSPLALDIELSNPNHD